MDPCSRCGAPSIGNLSLVADNESMAVTLSVAQGDRILPLPACAGCMQEIPRRMEELRREFQRAIRERFPLTPEELAAQNESNLRMFEQIKALCRGDA